MPQDIIYPQGCRPLVDGLGPDELIRRLKTLAHTLQAMGQDEGLYQQYIPLALHLAEESYLLHPSRDVQLLIACCIADVLRVYAPEAPYKDPDQVKTIFMFLIKQLTGLKDPKDPAFKRYFYLLENLAYVKSFNMCFDLEDCQEIFCSLFTLIFKIVNDEHSGKVKSFMLDVLCPLITESDTVSNELLDIILMNIVEPNKSQRKNAYTLAKELVVKCSETLEPYIQAFFNQVLIIGKQEKKLQIFSKVYDLIYELNHICPSVLLAVLPQLEVKLKSAQEIERLSAVALLARMFSEPDSNLARHHAQLWKAFLGRFNDISVTVRNKCVQYSMHFLLNHPELRKDITDTLKMRQHDSDESVRYEVVMAIVSTARRDFQVVSESDDLLEFVKERTLDKKFKIRKEAMSGLAMIYKKHLTDSDVPQATKKAITWIKDKILYGYYMTGIEDRLLVERLLNTCLVPYQFPTEERMKKLYYLLGTVDENASKAFIELQKNQLSIRRSVSEWLEMHRQPQSAERDKEIHQRILVLSKFLPDPVKAREFLGKFSSHLLRDNDLLAGMENMLKPDINCKECAEVTGMVLKKLGQPVMTNLYYNTVKLLLERISSVMVDYEAIKALVGYVEDCLSRGNMIDEIGLDHNNAGERGLKLLVVLSYVFSAHFLHSDVIRHLMSFLAMGDETVAPYILSIFTFLGKYKSLGELFPDIICELIPLCKDYIASGTPKQAKHAIRCLFKNVLPHQEKLDGDLYNDVLETIKDNLDPNSKHYRTAIVALGHVAFNLPEKFSVQIKNIVSRKIVKELLVKDATSDSGDNFIDSELMWCRENELSIETLCKVEGIKMMARWLLGLKVDVMSAQKTFRMMNAFIVNEGDLSKQGNISPAEKAWLRLAAGCAMLKICEQKGVGDQFTVEHYYNMSQLMLDECPQVREVFAAKLHKGLSRGVPNKCLPLDFMGFYVLAGAEPDKRLKLLVKKYVRLDVTKRRDYVKSLTTPNNTAPDKIVGQLAHILPDYMLVFAVSVLGHDPEFTSVKDMRQLIRVRDCLSFILEPLMESDSYSFMLYKELIEKMKNHKDSLHPEDEEANIKLWIVCDIAMSIINTKSTTFEQKDYPGETRIPNMYFKRPDDPMFVNNKSYIPAELRLDTPKAGISLISNERGRRRTLSKQNHSSVEAGTELKPSDTKIQLPGDLEEDVDEPAAKKMIMTTI